MIAEPATRAARRARAWVTSLRPSVAVLLYHRVADELVDPFGLCVSPERFEDQLTWLSRRYAVLSLRDLTTSLDGRLPRRAVLLTFDDGYVDLLSRAAPMLAAHRLPAVVFVPAAALGNAAIFWWDDLAQSLFGGALPAVLTLRIGGMRVEWQPRDTNGRLEAYYDAHHRLRAATAAERRAALDELRSQVEIDREAPSDRRPLTPAELRDVVAAGWMEVGAHTLTHPSLPHQTEEVQRQEILDGRTRLEALLSTPVDSFAYPHGHFDEASVRLVRECGFRVAFAASPGLVARDSDRYRLPRLAVPNCDGRSLCAHIDAWFSGRPRPWRA
jgi:peptidoglycan/xylan/chitin deacetylase (PgdA/CDA1 family)